MVGSARLARGHRGVIIVKHCRRLSLIAVAVFTVGGKAQGLVGSAGAKVAVQPDI